MCSEGVAYIQDWIWLIEIEIENQHHFNEVYDKFCDLIKSEINEKLSE